MLRDTLVHFSPFWMIVSFIVNCLSEAWPRKYLIVIKSFEYTWELLKIKWEMGFILICQSIEELTFISCRYLSLLNCLL